MRLLWERACWNGSLTLRSHALLSSWKESRMDKIPEGSTVILRAVVGSTVHGTNISDQADLDEMEIAVEPMRYVIGLQHWESSIVRTQPDGVRSRPGDLDLTIHSLRKFCRLSIKGNPSLLICLFVPDNALIEINPLGKELRQKRDMFLSKDAGATFL